MSALTGADSAKAAIRDAATVIVVRDRRSAVPRVLMGQRGSGAVFMPGKFVFPGGAVDPDDHHVALAAPPGALCAARLEDGAPGLAAPLAAAAIRELFEETGQMLGVPGDWPGAVPEAWEAMAARGVRPTAAPLQFVFRAITPPGRPRRFDARFFLVDAGHLATDPDDFSAASDELSHLQWIPLPELRGFDLPFITEVVMAEVAARLHESTPPTSVPFFRNDDEESLFLRLRGGA